MKDFVLGALAVYSVILTVASFRVADKLAILEQKVKDEESKSMESKTEA